ncbi:MAG: hypothetical protein CMP59_02515 [Flavobacteriales bacterium]|nr:hypothetical protein [Flavobacteriales bacterium]
MNKALKIFSTVVVILALLSGFGWMVNQISTKKKKFGFLTEPIKFMYSFPDLFEESVQEVKSLPKTYIPTPKDFKPINKLKEDLIVLASYSDTSDMRSVVLLNLRNDSILRRWKIDNPLDEVARIVNPLYYEDGSLVYNFYYRPKPGLIKLDSSGKEVWRNDTLMVHHGINMNKDGDIWACTIQEGMSGGEYVLGGERVFYHDYNITKYDFESGKVLFNKSITAILKENGLANYLLKSTISKEPIHLNDVQPALKTTAYYQEDDVFISLRNINVVLHYRPSTNELIELIEGPFIHQHDVDFLNDSVIVIFNNNTYKTWPEMKVQKTRELKDKSRVNHAGIFYSNIVSYNLASKEYAFIGDEVFRKNKIHTTNEGLMDFIDQETYFVEEQNPGVLWVIQNDKVIYKNVLKSQHKGHHHLPNWTRVIQ